jgi:hypothetical protein
MRSKVKPVRTVSRATSLQLVASGLGARHPAVRAAPTSPQVLEEQLNAGRKRQAVVAVRLGASG